MFRHYRSVYKRNLRSTCAVLTVEVGHAQAPLHCVQHAFLCSHCSSGVFRWEKFAFDGSFLPRLSLRLEQPNIARTGVLERRGTQNAGAGGSQTWWTRIPGFIYTRVSASCFAGQGGVVGCRCSTFPCVPIEIAKVEWREGERERGMGSLTSPQTSFVPSVNSGRPFIVPRSLPIWRQQRRVLRPILHLMASLPSAESGSLLFAFVAYPHEVKKRRRVTRASGPCSD